ncbi:MAG: hypothetical protein GKS06_07640 [Acidobacteria bacterium]|nr:hypothetical protein [Acidobacteriota bacterium]
MAISFPCPAFPVSSTASADSQPRSTTINDVVAVWWPLAASWLFMALEAPIVSAALARLANPEIQLAALGGVVYPLMLIIESPVIMLLAASTALSKDWASYQSLRRYMNLMSLALTVLHAAIAFTPLWDFVARGLIGAPEEIIGPARLATALTLPWTWSIAYRRFNQGVMIRHGLTRIVGIGTGVRLAATALSLFAFVSLGLGQTTDFPGVAAGVLAIIVGVVSEAIFIGIKKRPVVAKHFDPDQTISGAVSSAQFMTFYVPLALTSLLSLLTQPLGSAAISRMPRALESLAAWPIVIGVLFVLRAGATAYKEVVVALMDRPDAERALWRFTMILAWGSAGITLAVAFTPLADLLLVRAFGLPADVAALARQGLRWGFALPFVGAIQNYYVGLLVHRHETRAVTESMALFLASSSIVLVAGVLHGGVPGLIVGYVGFSVANVLQAWWVWRAATRPAVATATRV